MESAEHPTVEILELKPDSTEMVKFIASQMDALFNTLSDVIPFTTGDVMSACLCHMIEAGKIGRKGDMEGLQRDLHQSVDIAIAHYSAPERGERH